MFDELEGDIVLVGGGDRKKRWYRSRKFKTHFEATCERIPSHRIYARRVDVDGTPLRSEARSPPTPAPGRA